MRLNKSREALKDSEKEQSNQSKTQEQQQQQPEPEQSEDEEYFQSTHFPQSPRKKNL